MQIVKQIWEKFQRVAELSPCQDLVGDLPADLI